MGGAQAAVLVGFDVEPVWPKPGLFCVAAMQQRGAPWFDDRAHRLELKRKCMGIEPTSDAVNAPPNGFEDRGRHQACKHFPIEEDRDLVFTSGLELAPIVRPFATLFYWNWGETETSSASRRSTHSPRSHQLKRPWDIA